MSACDSERERGSSIGMQGLMVTEVRANVNAEEALQCKREGKGGRTLVQSCSAHTHTHTCFLPRPKKCHHLAIKKKKYFIQLSSFHC